jgi:trans-aconitate 2-methyltransferase
VVERDATDTWNPAQYDKFRRERERPFFDLLATVHQAPDMRIVDLGCGTGALTRLLHARLQARSTLGLDRSGRMLESARASELPAGLRFSIGDIRDFAAAGEYDLIFSNAAFHWVDSHETLVTRLAGGLAPGGQLAFQIPASHDDPSHVVAETLTGVEPFARAFGGWHRPQPVLAPEAYARLLYRAGFAEPSVRVIVYPHVLSGPEEVVEWMKGTLLTEYERHLPPELFAAFVSAYRDRLLAVLERTRPFFFPFKRILCWGQKGGREQPGATHVTSA